ncbi:hypothetical protein D9613_012805 [Agrocybe pediades]|uniref:Nephrocystin 3-like N-terminal domain-containing protein n=1 Tax=Agrocybe pediades TaxID=84607 RepID=A0A8H4VT90_9AGAR|nr:hypothetical protein D9613_012805 [Agrocybe pediades]
MAQSNTPVPPPMNLSHSMLHNPTFIQHTQIIDQRQYIRSGERPGYVRLLENVATAALHDSVHNVDPPKCHPNTRVAIIQCIIDWALGKREEVSGRPILWLKGGAGAGKSAIARSVAERSSDEGLLLGAFFFNAGDASRNHVGNLVATISYQISTCLPGFRDIVSAIIEDNPLIFKRSLKTQFFTLVIDPLSTVLTNSSPSISSTTPGLIIIDGLDECSAVNSQRDLVLTLQEVTNATTLIQFLVCSRPESHLNSAFGLSRIGPILCYIFLDDEDYTASADIRVYLEDKFKRIKEEHLFKHMLPDPWPPHEQVNTLVNKSSGQFIYAATVVRYIESPRHRPDHRLNAIFNLRPPFKDLPFTELDALYRHVISKAEDVTTVLDILAFPALYGNFQAIPEDIEIILQLEEGTVEVMLTDMHSIITISGGYVMFLHKSLADFLSEPQRSGDLYRDLSRDRLSHVARVISFFSNIMKPDSRIADPVSLDILQALQQFPVFEFFKYLLSYGVIPDTGPWGQERYWYNDRSFIMTYFHYLYCIKDICESTRLIYWEQIREYCECVLTVLEDDWSGDWTVHFAFTYHHLLHDPRYHLPRKFSFLDIGSKWGNTGLMDLGTFGDTICYVTTATHRYSDDIIKISHDLIGDIKKEAIFAKSACCCLALLCDEGRANRDSGGIYEIARHDRRNQREHPWYWRQMSPTLPSLPSERNFPGGLVHYWSIKHPNYKMKTTRIRKMLRNMIHPLNRDWPLYILLLELLPRILPLAGRYEPLMDMCRKKCLSSLSQFWPRKSKLARRTIDDYLCRMDSQEGMKM